jgi:hypothetical protein
MKVLFLFTLLISFKLKAEDLPEDIMMVDEAIQTPTMNIEGSYRLKEEKSGLALTSSKKPAKKMSPSEKLKSYRAWLEERNRMMLERKLEQIRYKQELVLTKQLEKSMNQTIKAMEGETK